MLQLIGYKTEKGLYFASKALSWGNQRQKINSWRCSDMLINEQYSIIESPNLQGWYFMEGSNSIEKIQTKITNEKLKTVMRLRVGVGLPANVILPEELEVEEHCWRDDDYDYQFENNSPYYGFRGFYAEQVVYKEPYYRDVEFEIEYIGEVSSCFIENKQPVSVSVYVDSQWAYKGSKDVDISNIVEYDEITKLLVGDLLIHNYPCELSQEQTYEIIRNYVNTHIDSSVAFVSSNYNFCFTVQKRYQTKVYEHNKEKLTSKGKSYKPPKFQKAKVDSKSMIIFEMAPKTYNNYPVVGKFKGGNLQDLADNIKTYLDELMAVINKPLCICPHCEGTGIVTREKFNVYR